MTVSTPANYWGDLRADDSQSPMAALNEQANLLTRQTKGLLVGELISGGIIESSGRPTLISMKLAVRVPALNDYIIAICEVHYSIHSHGMRFHDLINNKKAGCSNLAKFQAVLKECLSSEEVRRILGSLLHTAKATQGGLA